MVYGYCVWFGRFVERCEEHTDHDNPFCCLIDRFLEFVFELLHALPSEEFHEEGIGMLFRGHLCLMIVV